VTSSKVPNPLNLKLQYWLKANLGHMISRTSQMDGAWRLRHWYLDHPSTVVRFPKKCQKQIEVVSSQTHIDFVVSAVEQDVRGIERDKRASS
jgi:hypothetical protein